MPIRIGQTFKRRVELHDGWDELVIVGQQGTSENMFEWALQPVGSLDVVSATTASLEEAFTLVREAPAAPPENPREHWCDD